MKKHAFLSFLAGALSVFIATSTLAQETSADFSGGSVLVGEDARSCSGALEGNVRYVPSAGLVGHWKFDESGGSTAADSSGNGYDGTLINTPTWVPSGGQIAGALDFESSSSEYVTLPDNIYDSLTEGTIALWVYGEGDTIRRLIRRGGNDGFEILMMYGNVRVRCDESTLLDATVNSGSYYINPGAWRHIAYTSNNSGNVLYINGTPVPAAIPPPSPNSTLLYDIGDSSINAFFGHCAGGGDTYTIGGPNATFDGLMDDIRIYDRALSAAEVLALKNGTAPGGSGPTIEYCNSSTWKEIGS